MSTVSETLANDTLTAEPDEAVVAEETVVTDETVVAEEAERPSAAPAGASRLGGEPSRWWARIWFWPWLRVLVAYGLAAGWVTERMWYHVHNYIMSANMPDDIQIRYFLVYASRVVTKFDNPFFMTTLNAPRGVNLMGNTPAYGLTIPMVPVTLAFGPNVSLAVMTTLALILTAFAWYWFFARFVVKTQWAAFVAGLFCGFGPGMLSQALAHPNIASQFLIPLILGQICLLRRDGRFVKHGVIIGLLAVYQMFINEEVLFLAALCIGVFALVWSLGTRAEARRLVKPFAKALGVGVAVAVVPLAYPLYIQFFGKQAYHGMWDGAKWFGADISSFTRFASTTIGGWNSVSHLAQDKAEQNTFLGIPLLVTIALVVLWMWRRPTVRAVAVTGTVAALLSLGPRIIHHGHRTGYPGPYAPFAKLPLFDSVIATRWSLALLPLIAVLIALWLDQVILMKSPPGAPASYTRWAKIIAIGLVLVALVPLVPRRIGIVSPQAIPQFFTSGEWRQYVPKDRTIVPVPLASNAQGEEPMRWATAEGLDFSQPGGYFLGPDPSYADGRNMFGSPPRPTSDLFIKVDRTGAVPDITEVDRANALADLRYWRAAIVVLPMARKHQAQLWQATTDLLGFAPTYADGVWVWDVRNLVG